MVTLASFIPEDRRLTPAVERMLPVRAWGCVLVVDISGFTPLTEALVRALGERDGAEAATRHLNHIYSGLTARLHGYGGTVVGFSGDGMLCWFDAPDGAGAARRALAAAADIQAHMRTAAAPPIAAVQTVVPAVKTALAAGDVCRMVVGDPAVQCIDVMAGQAVDAAAGGEQAAGRGQIVVDAPTLALVRDVIRTVTPVGGTDGSYFAVAPMDFRTPSEPAKASDAEDVNAVVDAANWVLPQVRSQLEHVGGRFLGEIRPAVALFARFGGLDFHGDPAAPTKLDAYIRWVQDVLARYGGALIQLTTGDKGSYLYAAFGAPVAHDDDMGRAVAAARRLLTPPPTLPYCPRPQIGMAHGRMRVGPYGSAARASYGVQGAAVNLAARLMMQAQAGEIILDAATADLVTGRAVLTPLPPVLLKGHDAPSTLYRLGDELAGPHAAAPMSPSAAETPLYGRAEAQARLDRVLASVRAGGRGASVIVTGDAGMGKSRLLSAWLTSLVKPGGNGPTDSPGGTAVEFAPWQARHGHHNGLLVASGAGRSTEQRTAYFGVRPLVRTLLGLDDAVAHERDAQAQDDKARETHVAQVAAQLTALDPAWPVRAPLLADVLDLPIPDNAVTAAMDARLRREALHDLLVSLVERHARTQPVVLVVDDGQWLDEASAALWGDLEAATRRAPVLLVLAQRADAGARRALGAALADDSSVVELQLDGLAQAEVNALVAALLGQPADALVATFVWQRSQGNPLMVETLTDALRRAGHVALRNDGVWALTLDVQERLRRAGALVATGSGEVLRDVTGDLGLNLPSSLHGLVLTQIDALPEATKLTLKTAAVLGRAFSRGLLAAAHPLAATPVAPAEEMEMLTARGILQPQLARSEEYAFRHNITQEVIYRTLLDEQRRELHGRAAWAWEQHDPGAVTQLAHHFYHADLEDATVRARSLHYLDRAAALAQRDYANETALHQVERALALEPHWARYKRQVELLHILGRRDDEAVALAHLAACTDAPVTDVALAQGDYFEAVSRYDAATDAVTRARREAAAVHDRAAEARALARLGMIAWRQGSYAVAADHYTQALTILSGDGSSVAPVDPPADARSGSVEADVRYGLGLVLRQQGQYDAALAEFDRCLALYRAQGNRPAEAKSLIALGHVAHYRHDLAGAMAAYEAALPIYRETGDRAGVASSVLSLGQGLSAQGAYAEAVVRLADALELHRRLGDSWWQIIDHNELGLAYMLVGQFAEAENNLRAALRLGEEIGDDSGIAYVYCNLGQIARAQGEYAQALALLSDGYDMAQGQGDQELAANCLLELALVNLEQNDCRQAIAQADASSEIYAMLNLPEQNLTNLSTLACAHQCLGESKPAADYAEAALALLLAGDGAGAAYPQRECVVLAEVFTALHQHAQAHALKRRAYTTMVRQAAAITDPAMRTSFLRALPFHRVLVVEFGEPML